MSDDALGMLLGKLDGVQQRNGYWMARCPAHDDREASLSITRGTEQPVVLTCHAGCQAADVLAAIGMTLADITSPRETSGDWTPYGPAIAIYSYTDERGSLLFQACRTAGKQFPLRRPDPASRSGWSWKLGGTRRVPYRLPRVLAAVAASETVYIAEGEKDVHALERAGVTATCNPGGAGKWRADYNAHFTGAAVIIVADKDEPGRKHAADVANHLHGTARSVAIVTAATGKDASDHLEAGRSLADLQPDDGHDADVPQSRLDQLRSALLDSTSLDNLPAPQPLIDGILYLDTLAWLHGKPGCGKSFIALDWAGCVSSGLPWQMHQTAEGPVLYVIAEGVNGLRPRVRAWEDYARRRSAVTFLPVAIQLPSPLDVAAIIELAAELKPVLLVIDTQARVSVGADENSAKDMGELVAAADKIRAATRACVLLVHHEARAGENMRGSTALEGAASTLIRVTKDGPHLRLDNPKQKDAAEFDPLLLRLVPRLESATVQSHDGVGLDAEMSASEQKIIDTLRDSFGTAGASGTKLLEVSGVPKSSFYRALNRLVTSGAVHNIGSRKRSHYILPEFGALP